MARYYRTDLEQYAPVSTELTGYAAAVLAFLHQRTGEPDYLRAALSAARFLARRAWDPELATIPFELPGGHGSRCAYFFDLGIIARGFLAVWRVTREPWLLEAALDTARAMERDFQGPQGHVPAIALPSRTPLPEDGRWSRSPGCYQLKAALAWLELSEITGDRAMARLYEDVLRAFPGDQGDFLAAEPARDRVMDRLHAYCYYLEGLLPKAGDPARAAVLREGLENAQTLLDAIAPVFERCDVRAQLLRLRLYCAALGVETIDIRRMLQEAARIRAYQFRGKDVRLRGGYCFGKRNGKRVPFANPATTAFAVQVLEQLRLFREGSFAADFRELI